MHKKGAANRGKQRHTVIICRVSKEVSQKLHTLCAVCVCVCACVCADEDVAGAIGGTGWDTTIKPYQRSSSPVQRFEPLVTRRSLNGVRVATVQHPVAPSWSRRDSNNGERKKEAGKGEKRSLTLGWNFAETVAHHESPRGQRTPKPTRRLAGNSLGIALASMLEQFFYTKGRWEHHILAARVEECVNCDDLIVNLVGKIYREIYISFAKRIKILLLFVSKNN